MFAEWKDGFAPRVTTPPQTYVSAGLVAFSAHRCDPWCLAHVRRASVTGGTTSRRRQRVKEWAVTRSARRSLRSAVVTSNKAGRSAG
jgi:hypothetical protein